MSSNIKTSTCIRHYKVYVPKRRNSKKVKTKPKMLLNMHALLNSKNKGTCMYVYLCTYTFLIFINVHIALCMFFSAWGSSNPSVEGPNYPKINLKIKSKAWVV